MKNGQSIVDKKKYFSLMAENLCGLQVKQFRKEYGIIKNVSDRDYVSNSFHCHVTEDITPITKQNREYDFWELFNGGKIQYVRYPIDYNIDAIRTLVLRAMEMGYYEKEEDVLSYAVFEQVAENFFKWREAQKKGVDRDLAKGEVYPV